ncbi:MAG: ileS [Microgenomates bacterium 39_7]|nr:MAG: ileS [Microgenomates bacterium 39_7]
MPKLKNFRQPPNLPELEEDILKFWEADKTFQKSVDARPKEKAYVFYDGPPFATGMPHYGHLLASTTKDVIPRFQTMMGKKVNRVWGWDCHGLPIENMIESKLGLTEGRQEIEQLGIDKFNQACRAEVLRLDSEWEKIISRIGRWVDFENNYKTMDKSFMESVWWGFKQLFDKGLVYEGKKVILYCPRCSTPLSNFEIAMDNSYDEITELSTIYKYPVKNQTRTYLLAWSTTPWNKLATPALAVNPKLTYVKVKQGDEYYYLAKDCLSILSPDPEHEILEEFKGKELTQFEFKLHFDFYPERSPEEKAGVILADEFVTADEGTGVVTLAAYGEDDFRVMNDNKVQIVIHVDDEGKLKDEVTPWAGMSILEANRPINKELASRGLIYREDQYTHSVPVCYRCGTRLYYAPVPAWFIDVQALKESLIAQNEKINWYPDHLKHGRFLNGLKNAPDWNISRSRYWGTPMPIWRAETKKGETLLRVVGSVDELKKWAVNPKETEGLDDIHRENLDHIELYVDDARTVVGKRVPEVFDCWVESGSMSFASIHYPFENQDFFENNYPAQFVSEYIAQTRAWFYTMHVISVGIFGQPPFENVLTTGTILAEDGSKMSKSKKNFPDPMDLINKYGADALRLYLMSSSVMKAENLSFSEKEVSDLRRKVFLIWWNMISFYKLFADTKQGIANPPANLENILDNWLVSRTNSLTKKVTTYLEKYDVVRASRELISFVNEFSTWYLRLSRERLKSDSNQQSSQVLGWALYRLAQLFAPLCPFFSELVHHNLVDDQSSIHLSDWPKYNSETINPELEKEMLTTMQVVELGRRARAESGIKLRHPLQSITIFLLEDLNSLNQYNQLISEELNVKGVFWKVVKDGEPRVEYDLVLTPELEAEAEARDLIREIQDLRKNAKLKVDQQVVVLLPAWPLDWQKMIEQKTNTSLKKGDKMKLVV